ncbi:hypothetical protein BC940DRAFT_292549 [Gongronella butleri]|nr:hypothetical protein BC940DRAFT_292549 [Gongronella butleri]
MEKEKLSLTVDDGYSICLESVNDNDLHRIMRSLVTPVPQDRIGQSHLNFTSRSSSRCESAAIFNYITNDEIRHSELVTENLNDVRIFDIPERSAGQSKNLAVNDHDWLQREQLLVTPPPNAIAETNHQHYSVTKYEKNIVDVDALSAIRRDSDALIKRRHSLLNGLSDKRDLPTTTADEPPIGDSAPSVTQSARNVLESIRRRRLLRSREP